jgi:hypothetical protein
LLILAAVFGALFVLRIGGAHRKRLLERWPAVLLAVAAIFLSFRGAFSSALLLGAFAALAWFVAPRLMQGRRSTQKNAVDPADIQARALLGVGPSATEAEIRAAYRAKMAQAHPDRGGKHADAAKLTAARDRLLRKG